MTLREYRELWHDDCVIQFIDQQSMDQLRTRLGDTNQEETMLTRRSFSILLGSAAAAAATTLPVWAKGLTWNLANDYPASSLPGKADQKFSELVAAKSDGAMKINVHLGGSLGFNSSQMLDAIGTGALEMGDASTGWYGGADPLFFAPAMPFFANTPSRLEQFLGQARPHYEAAFDRFNHKMLYAAAWTSVGIFSHKPLTTLADFSGLKIRVADKYAGEFFGKLGASPVQLPWGDVLPQVATGALDAVLTSTEAGLPGKLDESLKFYNDYDYNMGLNVASANLDLFNGLTDEQKEILLAAAAETEADQWLLANRHTGENHERFRSSGGTVVPLSEQSPELAAALAEAADPILGQWQRDVGERADDIMTKYRPG